MKNINKIVKFIKNSYSFRLRIILLVIFVIGLIGTSLASSYQLSTINQRIAERKTQIGQEYQQEQTQLKQDQEERLIQQSYILPIKTIYGFDPKQFDRQAAEQRRELREFAIQNTTVETKIRDEYKLNELKEFKSDLESGFYYFFALLCFLVILVIIPIIRLVILISKSIWKNKGEVATLFMNTGSKLSQMSSFQKYSLVLSTLVLVALIIIIIVLIN